MTVIAVGLLLLDGILLLMAAWYLRSWLMAALGVALLLMSAGIVVYSRRYARTLAEVAQVRDALQAEIVELRRLVQQRDSEPGT